LFNECQRIYGQRDDLLLVGTQEAALSGADAWVICTEWSHFRASYLMGVIYTTPSVCRTKKLLIMALGEVNW
jgi:hypothetical protein